MNYRTTNQKWCIGCEEIKNINEFYIQKGTVRQARCKPCHNKKRTEYNRARRPEQKERKERKRRERKLTNPMDKLTDEQKAKIRHFDTERKLKRLSLKNLAIQADIPISNIKNWRIRGHWARFIASS